MNESIDPGVFVLGVCEWACVFVWVSVSLSLRVYACVGLSLSLSARYLVRLVRVVRVVVLLRRGDVEVAAGAEGRRRAAVERRLVVALQRQRPGHRGIESGAERGEAREDKSRAVRVSVEDFVSLFSNDYYVKNRL